MTAHDPFFSDIQDIAERKARLVEAARDLCETLRAGLAALAGKGEQGRTLAAQVDRLEELVRLIGEIDSGTA
ncbi:hypothetical protein [Coralloluteibacterium thermophilus]|uniref:Uncharacterized protein n=1 Tax=Coralloluteibacterium thermophilum TaxID=2707049 RepID=A0ABV9NPS9_9GAMM